MKILEPTIGSDIETFLMDTQTHEFVSAEGIAKGTKHKPFVFDKGDKNFATSLDNVLFEVGIAPAKTKTDFISGIFKSLNYIQSVLPSHLCTAHVASAVLPERFLQTKNAQTFGCEPDLNAWTLEYNPRPNTDTNLRSAGLHVHLGYQNPSDQATIDFIQACDIYLGLPSVLIDPDTRRRELYGKAGAFRFKPYGGEYRTLSGYFVGSEELIEFVYNGTIKAIEFVNQYRELMPFEGQEIQEAINNSNKRLAKELIVRYRVPMI